MSVHAHSQHKMRRKENVELNSLLTRTQSMCRRQNRTTKNRALYVTGNSSVFLQYITLLRSITWYMWCVLPYCNPVKMLENRKCCISLNQIWPFPSPSTSLIFSLVWRALSSQSSSRIWVRVTNAGKDSQRLYCTQTVLYIIYYPTKYCCSHFFSSVLFLVVFIHVGCICRAHIKLP